MPNLSAALRPLTLTVVCLTAAWCPSARAAPSVVAVAANAAESAARYIGDRLAFDVSGTAAWRAAWTDDRNPGFHLAGGGGEINLGLEFDSGLGFLIGGRALFLSHVGRDESLSGLYIDASGHAMGQLRVTDWVRLGLGASAGRLWRCCGESESPDLSAILVGGFLRLGFDILPRNALPRALGLWMRFGIDGAVGRSAMTRLPDSSLNIALGLGLRL